MYYLIFFSIILSMGYSDAAVEQNLPELIVQMIRAVVPKCLAEGHVEAKDLPHVHVSDYEKSERLKKLLHCGIVSSGVGIENGHIDVKLISPLFPKEVQEVIEECDKIKGADPVDSVAQVIDCFEKKSPIKYTIESILQ